MITRTALEILQRRYWCDCLRGTGRKGWYMPSAKTSARSGPVSLAVCGFDYIELFVGNVRQAAHYYRTIWGFQPIAIRGIESGSTDRTSIVMKQGNIALLLTGAAGASSPVAEHIHLHGEGVATIGFTVDNVEDAYQTAV